MALWFAALLGIGSLVLPVTSFERLAEASGLSSVVVAAQAPLGVTARVFIALAAAAIGALAGLAVARRVAAATHAPRSDTPFDVDTAEPEVAVAKRPISAHAEFGFAGFDIDEGAADAPFKEPATGRRPLSEGEQPARPQFFEQALVAGAGTPDSFEADTDSLDLAIADDAEDISADEADDLAPPPIEHSEEVPMTDFEPHSDRIAYDSPEPEANTATAQIPIVELVERFARALERHRTEKATEVQSAKQDGEAVVDLTSALAPKVDALTAEAPVPPAFQPLHLSNFDEDEEAEDADESYPSLLAMKSTFGQPRDTVRIEDEADRIGDPIEPVVAFPGQAARASAPVYPAPKSQTRDTERALREALEKLQRMSGAA
ncbi:MAG: hypothetical protein ACK4NZ_02415 [Tsuneonella sp.]